MGHLTGVARITIIPATRHLGSTEIRTSQVRPALEYQLTYRPSLCSVFLTERPPLLLNKRQMCFGDYHSPPKDLLSGICLWVRGCSQQDPSLTSSSFHRPSPLLPSLSPMMDTSFRIMHVLTSLPELVSGHWWSPLAPGTAFCCPGGGGLYIYPPLSRNLSFGVLEMRNSVSVACQPRHLARCCHLGERPEVTEKRL